MAAIDVEQLLTDVKAATAKIIKNDISVVRGFSDRQLKAIAQYAALIAGGIETGQITEETREHFLDNLEKMTQNFLETLQGLLWVTIEKLWNAVIGVLWQAINSAISAATGLVLPVPKKV